MFDADDVAQAETEAAKDEKPKSPSLFAKLLAPFKGEKKEKKPKKEKAKKEEAKVRCRRPVLSARLDSQYR